MATCCFAPCHASVWLTLALIRFFQHFNTHVVLACEPWVTKEVCRPSHYIQKLHWRHVSGSGSKCLHLSCSGTEQRFMQASMAAAAGNPMLSDEEYDELKAQLRNKNSRVVQQASFT